MSLKFILVILALAAGLTFVAKTFVPAVILIWLGAFALSGAVLGGIAFAFMAVLAAAMAS